MAQICFFYNYICGILVTGLVRLAFPVHRIMAFPVKPPQSSCTRATKSPKILWGSLTLCLLFLFRLGSWRCLWPLASVCVAETPRSVETVELFAPKASLWGIWVRFCSEIRGNRGEAVHAPLSFCRL